jgi:hypothetical protein
MSDKDVVPPSEYSYRLTIQPTKEATGEFTAADYSFTITGHVVPKPGETRGKLKERLKRDEAFRQWRDRFPHFHLKADDFIVTVFTLQEVS